MTKLKDGRKATILEVYDSGKAFLVEFADDDGRTLELWTVKAEEIAQVIWKG